MDLNVKKERRTTACAAMRCKEKPAVTVPGICWDNVPEEERVHLCPRHGEIAREVFALDEMPGALRTLDGKVDSRDVETVIHRGAPAEPATEAPAGTEPAAEAPAPRPMPPSGNILDNYPIRQIEAATGETPLGMPVAELEREKEEAQGILETARALPMETQEDLEFAAEVLKEAKGKARALEERQKQITAPMRAAEKSVRDLFRPVLDFYATLEREIKARIAEVRTRQEEENRRAMAAAAEAHKAGDAAATGAALATVKSVSSVQGIGTRDVWDYEITDENALPRAFLMPNTRAIAEKARGLEKGMDPAPIPGVRWFKRVVVSSRSA